MNDKILLADDHLLIRKAIQLVLETDFGQTQVSTVATCKEVLNELRGGNYTHLVLDINFAEGKSLDMIPFIRTFFPSLKIMIFSMHSPNLYADAMRRLHGIQHYISKSASEKEIMSTFHQFLHGEQRPVRPLGETVSGSGGNPFLQLSDRERDVLHYLLKRKATREIASSLNLKNNTISTLKRRIMDKTQAPNPAALRELADMYGIS